MANTGLRFDGTLNFPMVVAVVAVVVGLGSAAAMAQATANQAIKDAAKYESLPERVRAVETDIGSIKDTTKRIEDKLDRAIN